MKKSKKVSKKIPWFLLALFAFGLFLIVTIIFIVVFGFVGPFQPDERNFFLFLSPFLLSFLVVMVLLWRVFYIRKWRIYILFWLLYGTAIGSLFSSVGWIEGLYIYDFINTIEFNRAESYCGHPPVIVKTPFISDGGLPDKGDRPYYLPRDPHYSSGPFDSAYYCTEGQAQADGNYHDVNQY